MKTTIKIPVFWALFPITLPILLVRIVLASVCAVVILPITLLTLDFGWKNSYKVLGEKKYEPEGKLILYYRFVTIRKVLIAPGWILRLAGVPSQKVEIYTLGSSTYSPWCYPNGEAVPTHIRNSIEDREGLDWARTQKEEKIHNRSKYIKQLSDSISS